MTVFARTALIVVSFCLVASAIEPLPKGDATTDVASAVWELERLLGIETSCPTGEALPPLLEWKACIERVVERLKTEELYLTPVQSQVVRKTASEPAGEEASAEPVHEN